jgi:hypothetical protein
MFAGEIGLAVISFIFAIFSDLALKVARSQSARRTVAVARYVAAALLHENFVLIAFGSLRTIAALSGANEAKIAPATMT